VSFQTEAIPVPGVVPAAVEANRTLGVIRAKADSDGELDEMLSPLDAVAATVEKAGEQLTRQPMAQVSDRDLVDFRQERNRPVARRRSGLLIDASSRPAR
jgi:hypothetical protein